MGYDFEALEDGVIRMELHNHNNIDYPNDRTIHEFPVKKGNCYSWDYLEGSVEIRER